MMRNTNVRKLTMCAMLAAIYVVLSLAFAPISFGAVQFRVSEALTLLPVFSPYAVIGVTVGCLITNIAGVAMGITMPMDILFGTLATLIAAVLTYLLRNVCIKGIPVLAALPPVLVNALVIGWEITFFFLPEGASLPGFITSAVSVGTGEMVACGVLGMLLVYTLKKTKLDKKLFE
ncbi:QueT transporter family protein [Hydrogenoanaerobacterium saccharovorans]|nr:QueT transporter family protein [Hydrogenoanaerobacterium saccharovorans]